MSLQFPLGALRSWRYVAGALALPACALVLAAPAPAAAQTPSSVYSVTTRQQPYQALPIAGGAAPVTLSPSSTDDGQVANHPLPFQVRFFGNTYSTASIGTNTLLTFVGDATSRTNAAIPATAAPNAVVAPWWDDSECFSGQLQTQVVGQAPNRRYVIQWHCEWYAASASTLQTQVWLHEGSSTIEIHYGAMAGSSWTSGSVGIENADGTVGYSSLSCSPNCGSSHWPTNSVAVYSQGPDLTVARVTASPVGYTGVPMRVEATATNIGGQPANGFGMRFWISRDNKLSSDDRALESPTETYDLQPGQSVDFSGSPQLPVDLGQGTWFILAEVDPANAVAEGSEGNNVGVYGPVTIGNPAPDLVVESIAVPAEPQGEGMLRFSWNARNRGNARGAQVPYTVVLSTNDLISPDDLAVGTGVIDVDALSSLTRNEEIALPANVLPGRYYIGIVLDRDNVVVELDETNNTAASATRVEIHGGSVAVATADLPAAEVGAHYCAALDAVGGDGSYTWSIAQGTLPAGLGLVTEGPATLLCGVPGRTGTWEFTATVESAGATASAALSLEVRPSGMPLTLATWQLPVATFEASYEASLLAVGGKAPYQWSLAEGKLPAGISLGGDGILRGTALEDGSFALTVQVEDAAGNRATGAYVLVVSSPERLTCTTRSLQQRTVGESFAEQITAAGGTEPYTFTNYESRRLANGTTDSGQTFINQAPPGLILGLDGRVTGMPSQAGRYAWQIEVEDAAGAVDTCTLTFEVGVAQGLTVTTTAIAEAYVGVPYRAQLSQAGGQGVLTWKLARGAKLPDGLSLSEEGVIEGVVAGYVLEGERVRDFAFLVQVRDSENREQVAPLSIRVRNAPAQREAEEATGDDEEGGCQAGAAAPSLLAVGLALSLLRRRR